MDDPCKHEKKNGRTMPVAINIGAGAGIGGIVLFGGSLVTATLVAFNRRRRRSSSENIYKSRSPSPETQTVDAPNQLESLPFNLQKPSNDEEMSLKEIQINNIKDLTLDEKHNSVIDVAEQENKTICVDSVTEEHDNGYKKTVLDCEEQVVMAADIESGPPSSDDDSGSEIMERDVDGEEQKSSILIDNENDEHVETKSLISDGAVKSIEEHEANEVGVRVKKNMTADTAPEAAQYHVPLGDDKLPIEDDKMPIEVDKMPIEHVGEAKETVIVNEEAASVNHVDAEDNPQLKYPEKEAIQEEIKVSVVDDDQRTVKEDNPPTQLMNKEHKDAEEKITEDEKAASVNHVDAEDNPQSKYLGKEAIQEEIKVSVVDDEQRTARVDNPTTQLMNKEEHKDAKEKITEDELIKKDEIQSIEEDEDSEKDGRSKTEISSDVEDSSTEEQTQEAKISNQKNQEHMEENQTSVLETNQLKKQRSVTRRLKNAWRKLRQS